MKLIFKWVAAFVLAALLFVCIALVITWDRESEQWYVSPHERRAWAEEAYLSAINPTPTAGNPQDVIYHSIVDSTVFDDSNPLNTLLKMEIRGARDEFEPEREVVRFNIRDQFSVGAARGIVNLVATTDPAMDAIKGGTPPMLFYNSALEELTDDSEIVRLVGQEKQRFRTREREPGSCRLFVRFELEGSEEIHWDAVNVFNAETGCQISTGHAWTSEGSVCIFSADLWVLHDPAVAVVMDVTHGDPVRSESPLRLGEVFNDGEVRVEIAGIFKGEVSRSSTSHDSGRLNELIVEGDGTTNACSISYVVNPPSFANSIEFSALDGDGRVIENRVGGVAQDIVRSVGFDVRPDEIDRVVISRRPKITRLIAELDRLPGVRPENVDPTDLLDLTMPATHPDDLARMRGFMGYGLSRPWAMSSILQLRNTHGDLPAPTATSEMTVRELFQEYHKSTIGMELVIEPSNHKISVVAKTPVFKGAWLKAKRWLGF